MTTYTWLSFLFLSLYLTSSLSRADLMDMLSEAGCAARCFRQFTESLNGPDKLFLQQRPDLTQPHCINQKGECALCLEICQWSRSQTENCQESCQTFSTPTAGQLTSLEESACKQICGFARDLYSRKEQFEHGQLPTYCPRVESWPAVCYLTCKTDSDCLPLGATQKCCLNSVCPSPKQPVQSSVNESQSYVCTPTVPSMTAVPFVPGQPTVKQLESIPELELGSGSPHTTAPQHYQVELDWLDYYNKTGLETAGWTNAQYPAVFLVQLRLFHDPTGSVDLSMQSSTSGTLQQHSPITDRLFGEWRNLVWTTKLGAVLSDLTPGTWYQFRLLAVSSEGYGGWGQPSPPIRVRTKPEPPLSPRNLTEVKTRIFENSVDVTIHWQPPKGGNYPLKKYQITWRRYYGFHGDDRSSFTEYEANVPGDKTRYTIQNLKPSTSYKIEVKAVSMFEGNELKSHPISLYLNTIPIPSRQLETDHSLNVNDTCSCRDSLNPEITVLPAFYENRQLKAIIRVNLDSELQRRKQYVVNWAPRVCIDSQSNTGQDDYVPQRQTIRGSELSYVTLGNLRFQCHYKVTITAITDQEPTTGNEWFACFCTPSCQSVPVKSDGPPSNCSFISTFETMQPMRLTYTVLPESQAATDSRQKASNNKIDKHWSKSKTYNAILNWTPLPVGTDVESRRSFRALTNVRSSKHLSTSRIRGVRVTWGPRIYEPVALDAYHNGLFPHLDPENAQSKVVDPNSSKFILKGLQREVLYIVHVQPIGDHSDGPTSTIFFSIPNNAESGAHLSRVNSALSWIAVFNVVMSFYLTFSP